MCMKKFNAEKIIFDKFTAFWTLPKFQLWSQLLLDLLLYPSNALQVYYKHFEYVYGEV